MGEKNFKRNFRVGMIVLVALIGAAFCWRMVPRSFDSLLPDEQEREEEAFSITFLGSGTMAVSIYPEGSLRYII